MIHDVGCTADVFTNPLISSSHPQRATPIPPPIFVPKDVHEYIVPSICLPFVSHVYSEQLATTAPISPCHGAIPSAATAVKAIISGTLPIYPAIITPTLPAVPRIYPARFILYNPFILSTSIGVIHIAIITGILIAHENTEYKSSFFKI